jgi:hypothetical protein
MSGTEIWAQEFDVSKHRTVQKAYLEHMGTLSKQSDCFMCKEKHTIQRSKKDSTTKKCHLGENGKYEEVQRCLLAQQR